MLTPAPGQAHADAVAAAARGMDNDEPIAFVRHQGDSDVFLRGTIVPGAVLLLLPGIWTSMPPGLLAAMRARRACSTTGRCPICNECVSLTSGVLRHERWCPVADSPLWQAYGAWERQVGSYARGKRIVELPGRTTNEE